jgi:hypothetical protein
MIPMKPGGTPTFVGASFFLAEVMRQHTSIMRRIYDLVLHSLVC